MLFRSLPFYRLLASSVCAFVCNDYRSLAVAGKRGGDVSGLNAAEHLRSLYSKCGIIWCSDLDFSLHAFRMRIEYFFMKPVEEQKIKEGLSVWFERRKVISNITKNTQEEN